ncbi:MAG: orotate phosphoribosyltransferase [Armatimonadota bacterium]|nr:orotate phosphoribosyltransferase [Armatimonadota bacterium]
MLTQERVLEIFENSGALLRGHFKLTSGLHSDIYFEKFQVLQYPEYVEELCAEIARRFKDAGVELVVGPTTGGVLLAYEIGKKLGTRGIFAEKAEDGGRVLKRGFKINPGERVLVVDDVLTTGGSVRDTIDVVEKNGGVLVGVGLLVDRTGGNINFGVKTEALLSLAVDKWEPADCPQCKAGVPLTET